MRRRWLIAATLAGAVAAGWLADRLWPLPPLAYGQADGGLVVVAADGSPLRAYPSEDGVWRYPATPEQVSPRYVETLLTYEDRWFYWHPGINPAALARAAWQWAVSGRIVSGGSTLTMQVARMVDPALRQAPRSVAAKLRQMARALQLEWHLSKRDILTLYLNHAPMGGIVEGVEMASRAYLGKPARELSHAEAALLTALPQAPSRLRPDRAPEAARAARDKVLDRMVALGKWRVATAADARIEPVVAQSLRGRWLAPLAAERLRQRPPSADGTGRRLVRSTIDAEWQSIVENMLLDRVDTLPPRVSMAVLVMDNDSLEARVYAGSADFSDPRRAAHVDMVKGVRSPGSTLKPFLYAMALDDGMIHSESLLVDAPQTFGGYRPGNFQAAFSGAVSVSEALQRSLNVPAVDLLDRLGPARFASALRAGGMRLRIPAGAPPNLSLILGGAGTTLEELVGAYRALARGGMAGRVRLSPAEPRIESRIMSAGAAFIVRDILESGGRPGRPFHAGGTGLAWKTGTSFGFRDAWAVGVTDDWTLGVWVGRPDGTPNPGYFGANVAAPLLHDLVAALPAAAPSPRVPPGSVRPLAICWPLGLRADSTPEDACLQRRRAWVLDDAAPPTLPDRGTLGGQAETIWIDPRSGLRTAPGCRIPGRPVPAARWPAALQPWLESGVLAAGLRPPWHPACRQPGRDRAGVRLEGLETGALLRPVPGADRVGVEVRAPGAEGGRWWMLDGRPLHKTEGTGPLVLTLVDNGPHTLTVMDEAGSYDSVRFTVRGLPERLSP
ncbi:MAG: penicillin-binding protein 1C [Pigmentiphaga sp.]|uniref:penicillin-binding protein 1C n=1 Tax=Pigmentiphaga sp. TaxID=1977564 RepID=UPI0029A6BB7A|nr:penicillin-binding protein 1C [Pigmentiphaga sp.]MDX3904215.1 penicillin-binding protein 1C [Pigmentiphaga sp.]